MDKERFITTVVPLREKLMFFARRYSDDEEDAQDVIQEVFAKLWVIREELHKYDNITALSVQITKNLCFNKIKQKKRKYSIFEQIAYEADNKTNENKVEQKDEIKHLFRIVDKLPDLQQTVLRMKYVDDLDAEEIAQLLGCTREAVWMNLSRARKKVKELFFKIEGE
ncbi:MAG: RNA polymerase subunit sigma-70 [Bacteroidetes bacterium GWF2_40_14]|nr:MAG: RNA polymerase subunit sigma-70 [Bacteroidetes bacterium GWF2_40_14]